MADEPDKQPEDIQGILSELDAILSGVGETLGDPSPPPPAKDEFQIELGPRSGAALPAPKPAAPPAPKPAAPSPAPKPAPASAPLSETPKSDLPEIDAAPSKSAATPPETPKLVMPPIDAAPPKQVVTAPAPKPAEPPKPVEAPNPIESLRLVGVPKEPEPPKPVSPGTPAEPPKAAASAKPIEPSAPPKAVEPPKPVEPSKVPEASKPAETPKPAETSPPASPTGDDIPAATPKEQIRRVAYVYTFSCLAARDSFAAFLSQAARTISKKPLYLRQVMSSELSAASDPYAVFEKARDAKASSVLALVDGWPSAKIEGLSEACARGGLLFRAVASGDVQKKSTAVDVIVDMMLLPGEA